MNHTNEARRYVTPNMDKTGHVVRSCTSQVPAPKSVMKDEATGVNVALPSNFQMGAASDLTGSTESAANLHIPPISQTHVALVRTPGTFSSSMRDVLLRIFSGWLSCAQHSALFFLFVGYAAVFPAQAQSPDQTWKDHVVVDKGIVSVDVSNVLVGELISEIGSKAKVKVSVSGAQTSQRITVIFSGLKPEQGIALIVAPDIKVSSSGLLRITNDNGLFSVQSNSVNLEDVMKKLSTISGSDIRFLSPNDQNIKVKIFVENQQIQNTIGKIMESLPFGGYASLGSGNGKKQSFYVTSRKGADSIVSDAKTLLARIKKGEKPKPSEVKAWLLQVSAFGFSVDGPGTSLFIVPMLMLIDENYPMYKEVSLSILQDTNGLLPLRAAMLELAGRHWDDSDSRKTLHEVFQRTVDNSMLQGMVSLTLARHGENIGDLVVQRYPSISPEAKFYYAQTISTLGRKDAIPLLLADSQQTQNSALRDVATSSLIKLDPSSAQTVNVVNAAIYSAKAVPTMERTAGDMNREIIAMHTVTAVAEAAGSQARERMLTIARDESIAVDVRLTSLEALTPKVSTMSPTERGTLGNQLVSLGDQLRKSSALSEMNQQRMAARITFLQKMLTAKKGE